MTPWEATSSRASSWCRRAALSASVCLVRGFGPVPSPGRSYEHTVVSLLSWSWMKVNVVNCFVRPASRTIVGVVAFMDPVHFAVREYPEMRTVRGSPVALLVALWTAGCDRVAEPHPASQGLGARRNAAMQIALADLRPPAGMEIIGGG